MSVYGGPADWWTDGTNDGRTHIATKGVAQANLVINYDAGVSTSYSGSGTTWTNLRGANNGTLTNGPTFSSNVYGSIVFDGTNDYVSTPYTQTNVVEYTIDAWFKTTHSGPLNVIVQNRGSGGSGISITMGTGAPQGPSNTIFIGVDSNGLLIQRATTANTYADGNWYNAVGVFSQANGTTVTTSSFSIYVNGSLASTTDSGIQQAGTTTSPLTGSEGTQIGRHQLWGTFFNGSLASVKIYDRALTAEEISRNFNATRGRYGI
jgi:hypothetical protein